MYTTGSLEELQNHQHSPGGESQLRQDLVVQYRVGGSRARGQLQRCDGRCQKGILRVQRLPLQHLRPAGHLFAVGLFARGTVCTPLSEERNARCADKRGGGFEAGTKPLSDHRVDRYGLPHGYRPEYVRRAGAERWQNRLQAPGQHDRCAHCPHGIAVGQRDKPAIRHGYRRV